MAEAAADAVPVVAVDGPAAVGKGTVARGVAERLGFAHLDSGRFYRAVASLAISHKADLGDAASVLAAARSIVDAPGGLEALLPTPWLDGEEVGEAASKVAALPEVRDALMQPLRDCRRPPGIVADGRDMGSIVFPDADLKVFLTASMEAREERARERLAARGAAGDDSRMAGYLERFRERDARDGDRRIAPVRPAEDAAVVDTDGLSAADTVAKVVALFEGLRKA